MNFSILAFATFCLASLTTYSHQAIAFLSHPATNRNLAVSKKFEDYNRFEIRRSPHRWQRNIVSQQVQSTTVNLEEANLKQPYIMTVSADSSTYLTGYITVDGKVVKTFSGNRTALNLSPCLSKGKHTVQVSGYFKPATSSVEVELFGPGTAVNQTTAGNGTIKQTLILDVR